MERSGTKWHVSFLRQGAYTWTGMASKPGRIATLLAREKIRGMATVEECLEHADELAPAL